MVVVVVVAVCLFGGKAAKEASGYCFELGVINLMSSRCTGKMMMT